MKRRISSNSSRNNPDSNGPGKEVFKNKLQEQKNEAIIDSIKMLFHGVRMRKRNPSFPTSIEEFIKSNFPLCFADLEEKKFNSISGMIGRMSSISIEILKRKEGVRIFEWTMERAIEIAHREEGDNMHQAIISLFEASLKVSSLGKPIDVTKFFGAYKGMPISYLRVTTVAITRAKTYLELRKAVEVAHFESQQERLSNRKGLFSTASDILVKKS